MQRPLEHRRVDVEPGRVQRDRVAVEAERVGEGKGAAQRE
jgi:hypothetical protein